MEEHIAKLKDADPNVRRVAVNALGKIGDPSAIPALIGALTDTSDFVRLAAATELWKIGAPAIRALGRALRDSYHYDIYHSWEAIRETGDKSSLPLLIEALKDTNSEVRWFAAHMLEQIGDPAAVPSLCDALGDENLDVCVLAAVALGTIGDVAALPSLLEAMKDQRRYYMRVYAARAVAKIGDSVTLPRKILAASSWSAQEHIDLLERLRHANYSERKWIRDKVILPYKFPMTRALCQAVFKEEDAEARKGAQAVLNCLESKHLLRGSQPDSSKQSEELLRAAQGGESEAKPDTLLRAGEEPDKEEKAMLLQPTIWQRLLGKRSGGTS
ncbi:MAG: lyase domain protein repeat-containing protein [Chthonomonadales bacterium]|nr:lyase domain protein repeat-containing protein [Chthonomonadales bacterium]